MFTPEMLESLKKVEANRSANIALEPRRMTAEEKDALLAQFHPDYKTESFEALKVGPNKGDKVPHELAALLQGMTPEEAVRRMEGIRCGMKKTSCPDQIAQALKGVIT